MNLTQLIEHLQALAAEIGPDVPVLIDLSDSMRLRPVKSTTPAASIPARSTGSFSVAVFPPS